MTDVQHIRTRTSFEWIDALPVLLFGVFAWLIVRSPLQINHDCAYVLQCSQLLILGRLPYVGFIDVNPPLIFYLNTLPVLLSRWTGLPLPLAFSAVVLLLLAASTAALWYLFRLKELNLRPASRFTLLLGWILCSLFVYATGDFGQRDYMVIIAVFPFVLVRVIRYYGDNVRLAPALAIGLAAGIALCLKPNFFFIMLVPEAIALVHTKRLRLAVSPEILIAVAFSIIYLAHFFVLPPLVRAELFGRWIPFFVRYYGMINVNLFEHVFAQPVVIVGCVTAAAIAALAIVIVQRRGMSSLRIEMLSGVVAGSFLSYWIQQKGYSYHALPAKISFVMLALFSALWFYDEIMHRKEHIPFRRQAAAAPAVMILLGLTAFTLRAFALDQSYIRYDSFEPYRLAIREHSRPDETVLFINTILFPAYPTLVQTGRLPASRYLTAFPLAGFYYGTPSGKQFFYRTKQSMPAEEKQFLDELAADIRTNHPALIFIRLSDPCSAMPEGFNMDEYFHRSGFVADAMRGYVRSGTVVDFSLYVRRQPAPGQGENSDDGRSITERAVHNK
jgi:hypothetical protein